MDTKDIISLGKTEESSPLVIGNEVFEKDIATNRLFRFPRKHYVFLNLIHDGLSTAEAALKSGVDFDVAESFRSGPRAAEYLEMLELREIVSREAKNADRWWTTGYLAMEGKKAMTKVQCEIYKEHGKRIQPCSESSSPSMKVEIIISPDALQKSKERRLAIETQLVEDLKHAV